MFLLFVEWKAELGLFSVPMIIVNKGAAAVRKKVISNNVLKLMCGTTFSE